MSRWSGVITNGGSNLLNEWVNEKTLNFDKAVAGTGTITAEAMLAQSGLANEKQTANIIGAENVDAGIRLKLQLNAAEEGYTINQIGVWASVDTGETAMIALFQNEEGVPVPSKSDHPEFVYTFYALISSSNTSSWTVTLDPSALVAYKDLNKAVKAATESALAQAKESGEFNGYTPVKGTDYYTEEEKEELVAEVLAEVPVAVTEDGYTEITGLPQILSGTVVKDGNKITITTPLDSGETLEAVIVLNDAGYPATITCDGREMPWTWTGFDSAGTDDSGNETVEGTTYFYDTGDACEAASGGWVAAHDNGTLTMGESAMSMAGVAADVYCELSLRSVNKIDLTDYSKISFRLKYDGLIENEYAAVGVTTSDTFQSKSSFAASAVIQESADIVTYQVDVSGLSGEYYLALFGFSAYALGTGYTVHQIWGE